MTVDDFINRWRLNEGGAERANYVLFLTELCALLELPQPDPADATHERNDYVFERAVQFKDEAGGVGHGRIDLYRRGAFVLEAKQSRERGGRKEVKLPDEQQTLPGFASPQVRGRRSAQRGWDVLMRNAREQAEQYARALPIDHGWPPFILACDVGHAIEVFADFSGQGKNYRQFPDRAGFRIYLDDLRDEDIRSRLRAIWLDPHSLDPSRHAAAVTRDIAKRLASISKLLEERGYQPEPVAHFLMRCLFTMFAEEEKVRLLPRGAFTEVLSDARSNPASFGPMLEGLWRTMDTGGFSELLRQPIRRFNGGLFKERAAIPLRKEEIGELYEAAQYDWTEVEPAIFGTLLEQALDGNQRKRLGAHYTPRAYVERLVVATIIEPLQREWETQVLGTVERERANNPQAAIKAVHDFHEKLASTRVLDPACGTGNFLYVALELMKRLEGDVLEVLADIGGQEALALETATVHPRNFLGLELNPRAAAISELVLWLGYLQWQLRNRGEITDPVLERLENIQVMDAVLSHDAGRLDEKGDWLEMPNPRRPAWPEADFIVGNPPFIGKGAALRFALGDSYCEALWKAHPKINKSADFVMYWWDRAAERLTEKGTRLRRFGLVTTNSITQSFSRRVMARRMAGATPIRILAAYPDHPWTKATPDAAAVRIAMTVGSIEEIAGVMSVVDSERELDTDKPQLTFVSRTGSINSDLTIGADVTTAKVLKSNQGLCFNGVMMASRGFLINQAEAEYYSSLGPKYTKLVRRYVGGAELARSTSRSYVIDTYGLSESDLFQCVPKIGQHLAARVKPAREMNRDKGFREGWWLFGRNRPELRAAISNTGRYIGTTETSRYRTFQFINSDTLPDHMVVSIALDDYFSFGVLSSTAHLCWIERAGGWLGVGNDSRYSKSLVFDTFAFPVTLAKDTKAVADAARELDIFREAILAEHPDLGLAQIYKIKEKLCEGCELDELEQEQRFRARVDVLVQLHVKLDAAVAKAYGWPASLSNEEIVSRLVELNAERHSEERNGTVHWLRAAYQLPRAGIPSLSVDWRAEQLEASFSLGPTKKPVFPRDAIGQTAAVIADLRAGARGPEEIAQRYKQGRKLVPRIEATLEALVRLGHVSANSGDYLLRRVA